VRKHLPAILVTAGLLLAVRPTAAWGLQFEKSEYAARRAKLMDRIPDGAAVLLGAQPITGYNPFVQNNDLMYFCGVEIPNAVLVVDAGPDVGYYDVDISLSFPANGKFTPRQREICEDALAVLKECLALYRPGATAADVQAKVRENLARKGFDMDEAIFKMRSMQSGISHDVGLAVHDVVSPAGRGPLRAGQVFACDIYAVFLGENLDVRIEDTVVITETGCEVLTKGIPREVAEIEALMRQPGLIQVLKEKGLY